METTEDKDIAIVLQPLLAVPAVLMGKLNSSLALYAATGARCSQPSTCVFSLDEVAHPTPSFLSKVRDAQRCFLTCAEHCNVANFACSNASLQVLSLSLPPAYDSKLDGNLVDLSAFPSP